MKNHQVKITPEMLANGMHAEVMLSSGGRITVEIYEGEANEHECSYPYFDLTVTGYSASGRLRECYTQTSIDMTSDIEKLAEEASRLASDLHFNMRYPTN